MKSNQSAEPADGRYNWAAALRKLLQMPVTAEVMACIAIAALITLQLAPILGRAMPNAVPNADAFIAFTAGMFIILLGVVAAAAHGLTTWLRARAAARVATPTHRTPEV